MERHTKEAQSRSAEETLRRWVEARHLVRDFERALRKAQERLRVLERDNPWLGSIKGILRKKDGKAFNIPEGPKVARVAPQEEKSASSSKQEQANPRREKAATETRKRPAAPLMEKSRREADAKRKNLQTPPGSSFHFYSEEVPPTCRSVGGAPAGAPEGTCIPETGESSWTEGSTVGEDEGSRVE
jgi:hypothetical protein